jgi:hypothetical protein
MCLLLEKGEANAAVLGFCLVVIAKKKKKKKLIEKKKHKKNDSIYGCCDIY